MEYATASKYGNGGTASAINMPGQLGAPTGALPQQLDEQQKQVHLLHSALDQLGERMASVLAPAPPAAQTGVVGQPPETTQIVRRVQDHTAGLCAAIERLHILMNRLEL